MGARSGLPARVGVAIGLVAASTLALQVLLTRLFAATLIYHFTYLVISLALLGTGVAALLVYLRPGWFAPRGVQPALARWSLLFAGSLAVLPIVLVRLDLPVGVGVDGEVALKLAIAALVAALAFFTGGAAIAIAIRHYVRSVGRLYAFDLVGAGAGAALIVPLMWAAAPAPLIVALAAAAAAAAALAGWVVPLWRRAGLVAAGLAVAAALIGGAGGALEVEPRSPIGPGQPAVEQVSDRWTPLSRVVGYAPEEEGSQPLVTYDLDIAPVPIYERGQPSPDWRELALGPQSIGYELTGPGDALIIGGGGGRDIHNALSAGQRSVDVIELNRAIRDTVDVDLAAWSGAPYSLPKVSTSIGDGRSELAARDRLYDQIHIGFTNTLSGNAGSAYALTENHLYTVEAFDTYLDHLAPGGVLNVSRLHFFSGEEAMRVTILALEALRRRGVADPERHVVTVLGTGFGGLFGTVLARNEPFTEAEIERIRELADERADGVAFAPGGPYQLEWQGLAAADDPLSYCAQRVVNVCPPTDEQPFFFNSTRISSLGNDVPVPVLGDYARTPYVVLLVTLAILAVLCVAGLALPLAIGARGERPPLAALAYFTAIGFGFLTLEIVLIQRLVLFLGFPTYALSVVIAGLLIFSGLGALATSRWSAPERNLRYALLAATVLSAVVAFAAEPLLRGLIDLPFAVRISVALALLAPLGLALGTAMPIGLARMARRSSGAVAWAWATNAIASVLASVLATAVGVSFGLAAAGALAMACYLVALLASTRPSWAHA